jgi:hypothetical protein
MFFCYIPVSYFSIPITQQFEVKDIDLFWPPEHQRQLLKYFKNYNRCISFLANTKQLTAMTSKGPEAPE